MAIKTLILCDSPREGGHYAKRAGLTRWTYRVIHKAGQVRGMSQRGFEVHILPSFAEMRGRHPILAALRLKRGVEYIYVDPDDFPTLEEIAGERQAETLGDLTDADLEAAYADHESFDNHAWLLRSLLAMTEDDLVERLLSKPTTPETPVIVEAIKAKPKPRPKPAAAAPAEADFFAST